MARLRDWRKQHLVRRHVTAVRTLKRYLAPESICATTRRRVTGRLPAHRDCPLRTLPSCGARACCPSAKCKTKTDSLTPPAFVTLLHASECREHARRWRKNLKRPPHRQSKSFG